MRRMRLLVVAAAIAAATIGVLPSATATAAGDVVAEATWSDGNGNTYIVVRLEASSWHEALADAPVVREGAHLATITGQDESDFVSGLMNSAPPLGAAWLGGFQQPINETDPTAGWTWVSGEPWGYDNWAGGEPNDGGRPADEQHLTMTNEVSGEWNDVNSGNRHAVYIAEIEATATDTLPLAPSNLGALPGPGWASASWNAPSSDGGSSITGYTVTASPGGNTCTTTGALTCSVTGLTNGTTYTFTVSATNAIGTGPSSIPSTPVTPIAPPQPPSPFGEFTSLTPARVLDTRDGTGRGGVVGPLGENASFEIQITGRGGVADNGVAAVVMNVTVARPTAQSWLAVWPAGEARPLVSNLNYVAGKTVPNLVTVAVGDGGRVEVYNRAGSTHVIFDVVGFYVDDNGPPGSRFQSISPFRYFDTRFGTGGVGTSPIGPNQTLEFDVLGKGGVPESGVSAVMMNITAVRPTAKSYLTVYPGDVGSRPLASNLNYLPGVNVPNLVVVRVPASGVVDFYNRFGSVHVIADVVGYYDDDKVGEAGRFVGYNPWRTFDSRFDADSPIGPDEAWGLGNFPGFAGFPLGTAEAVVLNVTAVRPTAKSYLTVFPSDLCGVPLASNLNFVAGQTVPNHVVVRLGTDDDCGGDEWVETIAIYNRFGYVDVIVDIFGIFSAPTILD